LIGRIIQQVPLLAKFLLGGVPGLVFAFMLNGFLVEKVELNLGLAYGVVLSLQTGMNFFVCRFWVFDGTKAGNLFRSFVIFAVGILFIRLCDWTLYYFMTKHVGVFFIFAQGINIMIFALVKFEFCRRIFPVMPSS
jgi:putative flippase GtrA